MVRDRVKATLASAAKPPKVVELHPPSVDEYLRATERLADYANGHLANSDDELAHRLSFSASLRRWRADSAP
jgi:hypothetical protein